MGFEWFARLLAACMPCSIQLANSRVAWAQDYCLIMPSYESQATLPQYFLLKARAINDLVRSLCLQRSDLRLCFPHPCRSSRIMLQVQRLRCSA